MASCVYTVSFPSGKLKPFQLPSRYKVLEVLGEGVYAEVFKCWKKDTKQTVALKFPKHYGQDNINELTMLRQFKHLKLDQHNIVEFIDCFETKYGMAIVTEVLDISLKNYLMKTSFAPMLLSDIRSIIQQVATAFDALKRIGVIHCDVGFDNIMLANHQTRPFRVKLIDFSSARSEASQGRLLQPLSYRSPEILLGCPFSEAIDMWSLGCLMLIMVCGELPFTGCTEYEQVQCIIELLGQPADHLLNAGLKTENYFNRTESNGWKLKKSCKYFRPPLDALKESRLEENNEAEATEREQCIELVKAMLKMDADERITPGEVLTHPFITKDYPNNGALAAASPPRRTENSETSCSMMMKPKTGRARRRVAPTTTPPPSTLTFPSPDIPPSDLILVRPAMAQNMPLLEGQGGKVSGRTNIDKTSGSSGVTSPSEDSDCEPAAPPKTDDDVINISPSVSGRTNIDKTSGSSGVTSPSEDSDCEPAAPPQTDDDVINISPDHFEDSASCENMGAKKMHQKKKNCFRRVFSWLRKTFRSRVTAEPLMVKPATDENTLLLEGQAAKSAASKRPCVSPVVSTSRAAVMEA